MPAVARRNTSPGKAWRELLGALPGYDPFRDAAGCHFSPKRARNALGFIQDCLKHVEGDKKGQPFLLERWQKALVANLFGWLRTDDQGREVRRYRELFLYVPRKNGKTPLAAAICLYCLFCDGEPGAQIYSAAAEKEQAAILFRHAKGMIDQEPELSDRCNVYKGVKSVQLKADPASVYKVLSADADTKHGGNSHVVLIDELHAQPDRELVDVLTTSTASLGRKQPLIIYITTADFERDSICNEKHDYARKVRDGLSDDPRFLPVIYETAPDADWTDPEVWAKANPNLGVSVSREYLEAECKKAKETPALENTFKRLHLNLKTQQDVRWLSVAQWDSCGEPFDVATLAGKECHVGLDLANTLDVAAAAFIFPPQEGLALWHLRMLFWVPEGVCRQRERQNRQRFDGWVTRGFMRQTDGDSIDFSIIRRDLGEFARPYVVKQLAFDPYNATQLANELEYDGFRVVKFLQSINGYNESCCKLEALLNEKQLRHGGDPVLRWMVGNVSLHTDGRGYKMPSRKKSTEKIDGVAALCMALGSAITEPPYAPPSIMMI